MKTMKKNDAKAVMKTIKIRVLLAKSLKWEIYKRREICSWIFMQYLFSTLKSQNKSGYSRCQNKTVNNHCYTP